MGIQNILHDATDRLNVVLLKAEEAFQKLNFGVHSHVILDHDIDNYCELHYKKSGNGFKFIVMRISGETELLSTSRETRILAAGKLNDLMQSTLLSFDKEVSRVNNAITQVNLFIAAVESNDTIATAKTPQS